MKKISLGKFSNELRVGAFAVACIIGLIWLIASTGKFHIRDEGYNIFVMFEDVSGLQKNSPVMLNGLDVGRVQELAVSEDDAATRIMLKLLVNNGTNIWADPIISIKTLGLMGEKYIHIRSMKSEKGFVKPKTILIGKNPSDMDVLFAEVEVISANLNELIISLNETINENRVALNESMTNISGITDKVNVSLANNQQSLDNVIENLEALSDDLKRNPWKLLYKPKKK